MTKPIILHPGKDKAARQGHPWIFSGAIAAGLGKAAGELRPVHDSKDQLVGWGYFNSRCSIAGRMVSFGPGDPMQALTRHVDRAIAMRRAFFAGSETTGYRVINGEGDFLPGLVVDRYDDVLVVQVSTLGMTHLLGNIVDQLKSQLGVTRVFEKSTMGARSEEGLEPVQGWLCGTPVSKVPFCENGLRFVADIVEGQKTGFFLDQRQMRQQVRELTKGKRVLNCFSYSGAFSIAALVGEAVTTTSVDISQKAIDLVKEHVLLNGFNANEQQFIAADVFEFLRQGHLDYDLVILDPPAFVKRRSDVVKACRGYKDINRIAMKGMPAGSMLLTSSCSHFIDDTLFQKVVFQAAVEAGRQVRIIDRHHYAPDHPENIFHPEGHYLKSLLLYIE